MTALMQKTLFLKPMDGTVSMSSLLSSTSKSSLTTVDGANYLYRDSCSAFNCFYVSQQLIHFHSVYLSKCRQRFDYNKKYKKN